jgi:DnaA-homolog protein
MAEQIPIKFEFWANQTFSDFFPANNGEIINHLKKTTNGRGEPFIFIWGDTGQGKTHLLLACCQEAYNLGVSSFFFDLADPTGNSTPEILSGLENFELVCFDNIQAIIGKPDWEIAFFSFFNQHRDQQHRLILTAQNAPNSLAFSLPDLSTRINWGLSLKINTLSDEEKLELIAHKAQQMGTEIAPSAARFLLNHYDRSLTTIWTALDKLDTASLAAKRKLTLPFLKEILGKP